ncbi:hypothetical protein [Dactylosporangium salmoneum]|uniref:DUF998 domain-containing protein n=1 Tax=Dactylosporangium salmoneum TaxID=53361 RepID=A0ABP5SS93_9ACTN
MGYLDPQTEAPRRPASTALRNPDAGVLYLRSYLLMRAVIGFIGVALPFALVFGDMALERGKIRGSLSEYFYTGMRDVFVGSLCVTGLFLITYKVFEHNLDNSLSIVAGVAALGVALFHTDRPKGSTIPLTPLQEAMGERSVATVHYVSAAVFIISLGIISLYFGIREGKRTQLRGRRSPEFWRRFHFTCAAGIAVAVVFIAVAKFTGWLDDYALIIGETLSILSFGASWLMKGLELRVLLGPKPADEPLQTQEAATAG